MLKRNRENRWRRVGIGSVAIAIFAYGLGCAAIASRQQQWIFNPKNDIELALQQPNAGGLVMQSTFTSMTDMANQVTFFRFFPIRTLITERFASLDKIGDLQVPLLLLHGTNDEVVPYEMSEMLYAAAPSPKDLFLIPEGSHFQIYRPGDLSYLKAIERFLGRVTK